METVYFTKKFTSGHLKGLTVNGQVSYPTIEQCMAFIKKGRSKKGFKASPWNGHNAEKIVDHSFQKYDRA